MKTSVIALFVLVLLTGFSLKVQAQTDSPILVLPPENTTNVSRTPSFSWGSVSGATDYIIAVIKKVDGSAVFSTTTTSASYTLSGLTLDANTSYYWSVQGKSSSRSGPWSNKRQFTTGN